MFRGPARRGPRAAQGREEEPGAHCRKGGEHQRWHEQVQRAERGAGGRGARHQTGHRGGRGDHEDDDPRHGEVLAPLQAPALHPRRHPRHDPGHPERGDDGAGTPQGGGDERILRGRVGADGGGHQPAGHDPPDDPAEGSRREQLDDVEEPRRDRPPSHAGGQPDLAATPSHRRGRRRGDEDEGHPDAQPAGHGRAPLGRRGQLGGKLGREPRPRWRGRAAGPPGRW